MMDDLRELYQEIIIDHGRSPRNFGVLSCPTCMQEGVNPLCGDRLTLYLQIEHDKIKAVRFSGQGCAISMASASLMTSEIQGKTLHDAQALFAVFHAALTVKDENRPVNEERLGKLTVLMGVKAYPARVKCATLAWHTLHAALSAPQGAVGGSGAPATTEK